MDECGAVRQCLASDGGGSRLVALSLWPLGLGRLVWMGVGELGLLGLGAVSLRSLVPGCRLRLVLVPRRFRHALQLVAGPGWVLRIRPRGGLWRRIWVREYRMGAAGSVRSLQSLVGPRAQRRRQLQPRH